MKIVYCVTLLEYVFDYGDSYHAELESHHFDTAEDAIQWADANPLPDDGDSYYKFSFYAE